MGHERWVSSTAALESCHTETLPDREFAPLSPPRTTDWSALARAIALRVTGLSLPSPAAISCSRRANAMRHSCSTGATREQARLDGAAARTSPCCVRADGPVPVVRVTSAASRLHLNLGRATTARPCAAHRGAERPRSDVREPHRAPRHAAVRSGVGPALILFDHRRGPGGARVGVFHPETSDPPGPQPPPAPSPISLCDGHHHAGLSFGSLARWLGCPDEQHHTDRTDP
jgi:hypothetical protein